MLVNRHLPFRMATLILCCLLGNTACIDVFGIGDLLTNSKSETTQQNQANLNTFAKSIAVVHPPSELHVDKPHQLLAIINDSNNQRILDATAAWVSSDPQIISIDNDGKATPLRPGRVTISAAFARLNDSFSVRVIDEAPHKIVFDKKEIEVDQLDEITLTATVKNRFDEKLDIPIKWSAENTRLIRFRKNGTILASTPGVTQIHATAGELKESIKIRIEPIEEAEYRRKAAKLIPQTPEEKATEAAAKAAAEAQANSAEAAAASDEKTNQ